MNPSTSDNRRPVAVVILNWNGAALLERFLPSVVANTNPDIGEVIVADNGSTDCSISLLKERFPEVKIIRLKENYGFAEGYNRAIAQITNQYVVLLNSDVSTPSGWIEPLYSFMEANSDYGACQPKIHSASDPSMFEYAGAAGGFLDTNGYPYCRGRIFSKVEEDNGQYDSCSPEVFWATGAALMVRRRIYERCGGLDPRFFAHMEEIDLCWRIRLAGLKIGVVTESVVEHLGGGSLPASNPRKTYLNFRNNLLMMHKNLPDGVRRRRLTVRRLLDTLAWAMFVVKLDFRNAAAIWRAHRDFATMSRYYTDHPYEDLLSECRRNILVEYYLKGHRKFSDFAGTK